MLFAVVKRMYINREVYLCNVILLRKILCYRYSTIKNFAKMFLTKFGDRFSNVGLFETKCMKSYLNLFRFDIFIVRCLGG